MPWRARTIVQHHGALRASRPQLKRDPLGSSMRLSFLPLVGLALLGCSVHRVRAPVSGGLKATAGCYRLSFGSWVPAFPPSANLGSLTPPSTIHLRPSGDITPRWAFLGAEFDSLPGYWHLRGSDSLIVIWDAGEMRVEIRFTALADSLSGYATLVFWHIGGPAPAPSATVSMVPVPCA